MHREFIQKLTNLVEANLANEKFGPDDLAREAGMSHTNLNRKLKTITNQNASHFIREIRLKKARDLLLNNELTVAEISYRVGFGSPTYFSRCFHEYFGVAPGEMRNHEHVNATEEQSVEPIPKKHHRSKILIGLIVLIPIVFFVYPKTQNSKEKSIAVLPFINDSHDSTNVSFINGVTETITDKLTQIKDLKVTSRTSTERYRNNKTKSTPQIARELGVKYILEGSGQKIGDTVLVSVQLIEARNDKYILSQQFKVKYENVLNLYNEIAFDVASEIKALITPEEKRLIQKTPTANPYAFYLYQRGRDQFDNYLDSTSEYNAERLFKKALALDSTFALAYSGLAGVYMWKNYWKTFLSENFLDSVLIFANKALAYDNKCAEAYYFRARRYYQIGKLPECLKEFDKALKLNPDYWKFYNHMSYILWDGCNDYVGVISNLNEEILRCSAEVLPYVYIDLGFACFSIGFPDKGKQYLQYALELFGDSAVYLYWTIQADLVQGNYEKAYQSAKDAYKWDSVKVKELMPNVCLMTGRNKEGSYYAEKIAERLKKSGEVDLTAPKNIGYTYWHVDRTEEAEYYFNRQIEIDLESIRLGRWNTLQRQAHFDLAKVYTFLGIKGKAYQYLDEVNKNQSFGLGDLNSFKYSPFFNNIRPEPRFQKILKDVEAKYQAEHERVRKWMVSHGLM
jgi:TolB-like protein/AraC-like DNA-binding protein/Tfp pilus assembly protein PilF